LEIILENLPQHFLPIGIYMHRGVKKMVHYKAFALFLLVSSLPVLGTSVAQAQNAEPARPGTLNYIEGSASIDGRPILHSAVGSAALEPGHTLATGQGRVELLLTPGVFFRLDEASAGRLISSDLTNTVVELDSGRAAVEVDEIFPQNNIQVVEQGNPTRILKPGFYEFDADHGGVRVFEGKAEVVEHEAKRVSVNGHHEFAFDDRSELKAREFDINAAKDPLYNWSSLRSEYLAEANTQIADQYGYAGFAPGWYWDPYAYGYTFVGLDPFWSPFGWGFYGGGFYGRGFYGGGRGFGGGGFHGGGYAGGGFHGGGGGGRR
jgi:hypothetical protein